MMKWKNGYVLNVLVQIQSHQIECLGPTAPVSSELNRLFHRGGREVPMAFRRARGKWYSIGPFALSPET